LDAEVISTPWSATRRRCDRALVPPGTNFSYADAGFTPPAVADPALRRR
jgi:hypothetical protein